MGTVARSRIDITATVVITVSVVAAVLGSLWIALVVDICFDDCTDQPFLSWEAIWRILILLGICAALVTAASLSMRAERRGETRLADGLLIATLLAPVVIAVVWWLLVSIVH